MKKEHFPISVMALAFCLFFVAGELPGRKAHGSSANEKDRPVAETARERMAVDFAKMPLYFIANEGQVDKQARFYAKASGYTLWLTREGLVFDSVTRSGDRRSGEPGERAGKVKRNVSRLLFVNADNKPEMLPVQETALKVNYFIGADKSKWHCDVPTSQAVLYKGIYEGIDLKVYGIEKQIEYDWIVGPGMDPGAITFTYEGTNGTRIDDHGDLLIETGSGRLIHKRPISYQEIDDKRVAVRAEYRKTGEATYGFVVGAYDKNHALIIDPLVLTYSTYLGGGEQDEGYDIAVDSSGNAYVTGTTYSTDFPTKNQYQTHQGDADAFVTKIDTGLSAGSSLIYSTYLGGGADDYGEGIAVDDSGYVYVIGYTGSTDFPTKNQYQTHQGDYDAFVTKLNTGLSGAASLLYSSYLGGEGVDYGNGIAVDDSGYVYVTGRTYSTDFPTKNQYQTLKGDDDAFVTKLNTGLSGAASLLYSTYLGGGEGENGHDIAVDSSGYVYVIGGTDSTDFPTKNPYQGTYHGNIDAFVTKLNTGLSSVFSLIYSTYLGGGDYDVGEGIAVDDNGYVYVTGYTQSTDFPTKNQYQTHQGDRDAFVTKINTAWTGAVGLIYSTYLGGGEQDKGYDIAVDNSGNAYVTGTTYSTDFPTKNQYQTHQGYADAFIAKINTAWTGVAGLIYSTYLGGKSNDGGKGIAVDGNGYVYVTGDTSGEDFPIRNQYQTYQGSYDAFVARFRYDPVLYVNKDDGTCGGSLPCYTTIQGAINVAVTWSQIWVSQGDYGETPILNAEKNLTLRGGWNSSYDEQTSNTTFIKAPSAPQGALTLQMLTIIP